MADLRELKKRSQTHPLSRSELEAALTDLRRLHGYTELTFRRVGDRWHLHAVMNPTFEDEGLLADKEDQWLNRARAREAGQDYNRAQAHVYAANEVKLVNGSVLDSYDPGRWIISRKRTQILELSRKWWEKYVMALEEQYSPGEIVKDVPEARKHYPHLINEPLRGRWVLEVSEQRRPRVDEVEEFDDRLAFADRRDVVVWDHLKHVYRVGQDH